MFCARSGACRTARAGRTRQYGEERISLAKRAGHARGWLRSALELYGKAVTKTYKAYLATYRPASGWADLIELRAW